MHTWSDTFASILPLLIILFFWIYLMRVLRRNRNTSSECLTLARKQVDLQEQELAVLRETNELLKKLTESRV